MRYLGDFYVTPDRKNAERVKTADYLRIRGTDRPPRAPRDLQVQPGPRGMLVTWKLPEVFDDIKGWRVYKDTEDTLYHEFQDRGTRSCFVETSSGATPPVVNVFISSMNTLGIESPKVQVQGAATAETGAPAMPGVPPGYPQESAGGGNRSSGGARKQ